LKTFRWLDNRKALAIAGIGLLPLIIYAAFGGGTQIGNAFWGHGAPTFLCCGRCSFTSFSQRRKARFSNRQPLLLCHGPESPSVFLLQMYRLWPLSALFRGRVRRMTPSFSSGWSTSSAWVFRRSCARRSYLLFVVKRFKPIPPQAMLFYGLMAGLGFGIYEGVSYRGPAATSASPSMPPATATPRLSPPNIICLNLIRLTTLPFLHASLDRHGRLLHRVRRAVS